MKLTVAIDGPAGAGKSTVAKLVAQKLGLVVLDTGAMYRALALVALREGVQDDPHLVTLLAADLTFVLEGGSVSVEGADVTEAIRTLEVGQWASKLSTAPEVREALVAKQQAIARSGGYVLEGRDVTTVVAPEADIKVFLTASIEERARRRWLEMKQTDPTIRLQSVVVDVVERDHRDYSRPHSPLTLAEDAHVVESYGLTPKQVADAIVMLVPSG